MSSASGGSVCVAGARRDGAYAPGSSSLIPGTGQCKKVALPRTKRCHPSQAAQEGTPAALIACAGGGRSAATATPIGMVKGRKSAANQKYPPITTATTATTSRHLGSAPERTDQQSRGTGRPPPTDPHIDLVQAGWTSHPRFAMARSVGHGPC